MPLSKPPPVGWMAFSRRCTRSPETACSSIQTHFRGGKWEGRVRGVGEWVGRCRWACCWGGRSHQGCYCRVALGHCFRREGRVFWESGGRDTWEKGENCRCRPWRDDRMSPARPTRSLSSHPHRNGLQKNTTHIPTLPKPPGQGTWLSGILLDFDKRNLE